MKTLNLSKLTEALRPLNLADSCIVDVSPAFKVTICQAAMHNQHYNARVAAFAAANPDHPVKDAKSQFWNDMYTGTLTPDTLSFLVHVIILDWTLLEDGGSIGIPYTPEVATELFSNTEDTYPRVLAAKLLQASLGPSLFQESLKG